MQTPTLSVLTAQPSTGRNLSSQVLAQALQASEGNRLCRRSPWTPNSGGLTRRPDMATAPTESEARLVAALLNQSLVQGVSCRLSVFQSASSTASRCGDGLVQHLAGRILSAASWRRQPAPSSPRWRAGEPTMPATSQQAHARLNQRSAVAVSTSRSRSVRASQLSAETTLSRCRYGTERRRKSSGSTYGCLGVDGDGLVDVEAGRVGLDVAHVELLGHLVHGEHVAVRCNGPAEQGQVVE